MKYELTSETTVRDGATLYRIRALKPLELAGVAAGDLGGFVGSEANLSQTGEAWVADEAAVWEDARIEGECRLSDRAEARGRARLAGFILMEHDSRVLDDAHLDGVARLSGTTTLFGKARVHCGEDGPQIAEGLYADFDISFTQPYAVFSHPSDAGLIVSVSHSGRICAAPSWDNTGFTGGLDGFRAFLKGCADEAGWLAPAVESWLADCARRQRA